MVDEQERLIADWFGRARNSQHRHYECANYFSKLNKALGIPAIVLSMVVGATIFVSLDNKTLGNYKIVIGIVSLLASVFATLHTFLSFSERAQKHTLSGAGYAAIRRELELLKTFPMENREELTRKFKSIKEKLDVLAESSPEIPRKIFRRPVKYVKRPERRVFHLLENEEAQLADTPDTPRR